MSEAIISRAPGEEMRQLYTEEKREDGDLATLDEAAPEVASAELSRRQVVLLNVSWLGINVMFLVLTVEVVPAQVQSMVGVASKGRWMGGMAGAGAILMLLSGPLVGLISDRLDCRFGRRRPVMVVGLILICLGLCGLALSASKIHVMKHGNDNSTCNVDLVAKRCLPYTNQSIQRIVETEQSKMGGVLPHHGFVVQAGEKKMQDVYVDQERGNLGIYICFFILVNFSYVLLTIPYNALIADKSHPDQRGFSSGVMGFMILAGNIIGASLGLFFVQMGVLFVYGCVMTLLVVCVMTTVVTIEEKPAAKSFEPVRVWTLFAAFWQPLAGNDFRWVFITRFLMQQGVSTVTGFLEFWLSDMVELPFCWSPERSVAMLLVPLLATAALSSIVCGVLSDKLKRRKIFVVYPALIMSLCAIFLAFIRDRDAYFISVCIAFFFGAGFGCFEAVDFALVMDVLPDERSKAKDLAVWHQAMILPQALAMPVGGLLLDVFNSLDCAAGLGYVVIFLVAGGYFFLSAVFVKNIAAIR